MSSLPPLPAGSVVTVGTFDGVHRGHRVVIDELARRAGAAGRASVLVTFEPHPAAVVRPEVAPLRLTVAAERLAALAETELDYVLVLRFDRALASLSAEAFVREVLVERCRVRELVVGHDHGFGKGRQGDLAMLRRIGTEAGFVVDVVAPVEDDGVISSSRIRAAVTTGDFATAGRLLGRPYRVSGRVTPGAGRGQTIGVPTINLAPPPGKLLPPDGVYAVRVEVGGGVYGGMMNQGPRPTFGDSGRWLEAHLFEGDGGWYGREVRIEWVRWLRATRQFASAEELRRQLARDRDQASEALADLVKQP